MKKFGIVALGLIATSLIFASQAAPNNRQVITNSLSSVPDRTGWASTLTFGIIPAEASLESRERFEPLIDHLEKKLGLKIKPYFGPDYLAVIVGMASQKLDFAYMGPLAYVQAAQRGGAVAFAKEKYNQDWAWLSFVDRLEGGQWHQDFERRSREKLCFC